MSSVVRRELGGRVVSLESGRLAKFANGAVLAQSGGTVVLATVTSATTPTERDFFPLQVEYREKAYAGGRIPGGYFKREGRPTEREIITSRLIDRPIRPLFPDGFRYEIQIQVSVLSADQDHEPDVLAVLAASAALCVSDLPFLGPIGAARVGKVDGTFVVNPTVTQLKASDIEVTVVSRDGAIVMLEAGANEVSEQDFVAALEAALPALQASVALQQDLMAACGKPKGDYPIQKLNEAATAAVTAYRSKLLEANYHADKVGRSKQAATVKKDALTALTQAYPDQSKALAGLLENVEADAVRQKILETGERPDGRSANQLRALSAEVGVLPRTHGSALFQRGQTQALVVATLGTKDDIQYIEELTGEWQKKYMLHYNFPSFATGEVKPIRSPGRREIGHGVLAEKALLPMIPQPEHFPYVIRLVSEILESNGSSSMASVCGASLALMDAGVPLREAVAGISIGLVLADDNPNQFRLLTDIQGVEDHYGDMDFKIAGSRKGITAVQLDIKLKGISMEIIRQALQQAREARMEILSVMEKALSASRPKVSEYAPRFLDITINPEKIKDIIGPGGKMIKKLTAEFGVTIDVENTGLIHVASVDPAAAEKAMAAIREICKEAEVGKIYLGRVTKIMDFGAFVEILPGTEGLVHISQLDASRVQKVQDIVREGDEVPVKVLEISGGKIRLSRKEALQESQLLHTTPSSNS